MGYALFLLILLKPQQQILCFLYISKLEFNASKNSRHLYWTPSSIEPRTTQKKNISSKISVGVMKKKELHFGRACACIEVCRYQMYEWIYVQTNSIFTSLILSVKLFYAFVFKKPCIIVILVYVVLAYTTGFVVNTMSQAGYRHTLIGTLHN